MKKSELRHIIKEEIIFILKEDNLKDLEKALKSHDWYYNMSDDFRVWKSGEVELEKIYNLIKQIDEQDALKIWKKIAPISPSGKQFKFPENVYKQSTEKIIKQQPKYEKNYKKGDVVLCDGTETITLGLTDKFIGEIIKIKGLIYRKAINTYFNQYMVKVKEVFSKYEKQKAIEGKVVIVNDYNIIRKIK